ncbi:MAG: hypothetical protein F6K09_18500, partial [Merismopedia sp. SIO2A8]|nr:hypothetical protein [Merismopedia sp. SIO2A8]
MSQSAQSAFVATYLVPEDAVPEATLEKVIKDCIQEPSWYFLRSPHKVSGIQTGHPSNISAPEGQVFNHERELRWKRRGNAYEVLLLSAIDTTDLSNEWMASQHHWHQRD